ncbi:MAG TPA: hypothetical protein VHD90_05485 [Phototrophicaceae bacterium]|nr:hypothetical protein [Phototrophicaceae bacterium]
MKTFLWGVLLLVLLLLGSTSVFAGDSTPTITPAVPSTVLSGQTSSVTALAWSPDGSLLASAAGAFDSTDKTARLWRADGTPVATLSGHSAPVVSLAWSPDGNVLATGGFDQQIGLWSPDGTLIRMIDTQAGIVFKLAWSPDGKILASGSEASPTSNTVQWWSADGDLLITRTTAFSGGKFYNLGWSPDGKFLVGGATSYTEWRADGTEVFSDEGCASCTPQWGFAWSPDGSRWAIGNESGKVTIYATDGRQIAAVWDNYGGADVLAWSPDGKLLIDGASVWSADGRLVNILSDGSNISVLAWSPNGKLIAGSNGWSNAPINAIALWDTTFHQIAPLKGHSAPVASLAWSPDGKILASGSRDNTIRLWQITS